jgi:hypothetical protein
MNNHKIGLVIPSTINVSETASPELVGLWVKRAKMQFAELFGGYTSHNAVGGWMSSQGLVEEEVTVVASFTDDLGLNQLTEVKAFARRMAKALSQEAVAIEIDHRLEFVSPLAAAA